MTRPFMATLFLLCLATAAAPQDDPPAAAPAPAAKPDYSQEPFVFEHYATKIRFENDGTGERNYTAQIRVQTDGGVQALGELIFGYNSANEQIEIRYVRVHKPEGSIITADPSAIKEMTAEVERDAPVYTDYKEKHVTVPSLKPGDTLEYEIDIKLVTALAPGEFWYSQNFLAGAIVLDESLEVNFPEGRAVKVSSPGFGPFMKTIAGRTIYTWKHSALAHPSDDEAKKLAEEAKTRPPDVQFTTFKSWRDVASWYATLEEGRTDPTPEIRAKVADLTQGKTTDVEKIQPLYDYVAKNIRYVSLSFGLGRYQPHTAAEVFANQYGDCKDKVALLAAMLRAAGIPSDVALIPTSAQLDVTMPAPSQFDHVISAVHEGADLLWMDTTTEIAPFRMLAASLRGKDALLVPTEGPGRILKTPADPPFLSSQNVDINGQVNDLGKLTGTLHYTLRGDQELLLRLVFRRAPKARWSQLGTTILQQDGLSGTATSVETSDPGDTREAFQVTIHFTQDDFLPWTSKEPIVKLPLLSISLPDIASDNAAPIELGSPLKVDIHLKLSLPVNFKPRAPVGIAVSRDYAEFKSVYSIEGQTLTAERSLNFKMRSLPAERSDDYLAFGHAIQSDENQSLRLQNASAAPEQIPQNAKVEDVMSAAQVALHGDSPQTAIGLFRRVVELDPRKYEKSVWNDIGLAYTYAGQYDNAIASFRKQLEINPYDQNANRYLVAPLQREGKTDDAVAALRKQLGINPLDAEALSQLGGLLNSQHKYNEASLELEKAVAIRPESSAIQLELGSAYLNSGANDKAMEAFDRAVQLSPTPAVWNNIAYALAEKKIQLDKAQQYAESAVSAASIDLRNVDLEHFALPQVRLSQSLAAYWDTLGLIDFQKGDYPKANRFFRAAWQAGESSTVADHLGQSLARQGQKAQAASAFAQALAAPVPDPDTRAHMILLLGGNEKIDAMVDAARPELAERRTFSAGQLLGEKVEADVALLLSPAGTDGASTRVDDVKFLRGGDALRPLVNRLREIDFGAMFPDASPAKLVRIGTLSCPGNGANSKGCSLILALPQDVHSVQ